VDCLAGAALAIEDKKLDLLKEEIVRGEREISPNLVFKEACRRLKYLGATTVLGTEEQFLAKSYWWLAKLRRDYPDEFKKEMGKKVKIEAESERDSLIQILEEKFGVEPFIEVLEKRGMSVKICGNCNDFNHCKHDPGHCDWEQPHFSDAPLNKSCWEPKEKDNRQGATLSRDSAIGKWPRLSRPCGG
jgi:hypothetical protein